MTKYYFMLKYQESIAAGSSVTRDLNNVLREIFPDKPFKLLKVYVRIQIEANPGDVGIVYISRNVSTQPSPTSTPTAAAGFIGVYGITKTQADGTGEGKSFIDDFKHPVEFDKDDSLNIRFYGNNNGGAARNITVDLILWVEA